MSRRETRMDLVQDPVTGERYWHRREIEKPSLDDASRLSLVLEILEGKRTPEEVQESYSLANINSIYTWIGM